MLAHGMDDANAALRALQQRPPSSSSSSSVAQPEPSAMCRDHDGSEVEGAALAAAAIAAEAALSVAREELEARQARAEAVKRKIRHNFVKLSVCMQTIFCLIFYTCPGRSSRRG